MGTRQQKFRCNDCYDRLDEEEDIEGFEKFEKASFWIRMEHMNKQELLEHIQNIECPNCGSDDWFMTDDSQI